MRLLASACCARKNFPSCNCKGRLLLNGQRKRFAYVEMIDFRWERKHEECSGTERCSRQAHTITAQILPDRFSLVPGAVELVALRSSTLFVSAVIGKAAPDFSVLANFFIKTSRECGPYFPASLIFVACHATACHRPLRRRKVPVFR
jgi:hypothetical protein